MERRTIERVDTGERLTLKYHDGFTGYSTESVSGLRKSIKSLLTGTTVGIYKAEDAYLDPTGGKWVLICEEHGTYINVRTMKDALEWAAHPEEWCEVCQSHEGRTFKDYGDGRLYEFGSNGGVEGSEWRWASVMEVNYAHDWLGREAEHLDAEKLALAEKLLRERHIELCRERGVEPLDLSECSITVWSGETCVTLNHPTHGIIASAVLLA
jgi:hypothetical protein